MMILTLAILTLQDPRLGGGGGSAEMQAARLADQAVHATAADVDRPITGTYLLLDQARTATDQDLADTVTIIPERQAACRALRVYTDRRPQGQEGRDASDLEVEFNKLRAAAILAEATFCVGPLFSRP